MHGVTIKIKIKIGYKCVEHNYRNEGNYEKKSDLEYKKNILIIKPTRCTNFSNLFLK